MALCALVTMPKLAHAQFETGKSYIGPHIGLGSVGGTMSYGGDFEYALTKPGEAGPGRIGLGATVDYWSWSSGSGDYYWSYSYVPVGIFGAYHFDLSNRNVDPYVGIGLGYYNVNSTWHGSDGVAHSDVDYSSSVYWNAVAGIRYFFSPAVAAQARLGLGASWLSVGMNFGL
jgi:hypothetical protein